MQYVNHETHSHIQVRRELAETQVKVASLQGHLGREQLEREWQAAQRQAAEVRATVLSGRLDDALSLVEELQVGAVLRM